MKYTLGTAAKETGKSKSTILRFIRDGRLSYESKEGNKYQIDAAELFRVFPKDVPENGSGNSESNKAEHGKFSMERQLLKDKISFLEKQLEEYRRYLEVEQKRSEKLLEIVGSQTKQITDQRKKKWWF